MTPVPMKPKDAHVSYSLPTAVCQPHVSSFILPRSTIQQLPQFSAPTGAPVAGSMLDQKSKTHQFCAFSIGPTPQYHKSRTGQQRINATKNNSNISTKFTQLTCKREADMIFVKKNYATAVLGTRILRKKRVNRDISQFATKGRKWFKMA